MEVNAVSILRITRVMFSDSYLKRQGSILVPTEELSLIEESDVFPEEAIGFGGPRLLVKRKTVEWKHQILSNKREKLL